MYDSETNKYTFYQCRYYNEVFGNIFNFPVPTSQTKDKKKKIEFRQKVITMLDNAKSETWPYENRLTLTIEVRGPKNYIQRVDIDNILKILLDTLKNRVFIDDKQIYSIMASKHIFEQHGFLVGLRILSDSETNMCIPPLYSEDPKDGIENNSITMWRAIEDK